jgi:hypothetical protein
LLWQIHTVSGSAQGGSDVVVGRTRGSEGGGGDGDGCGGPGDGDGEGLGASGGGGKAGDSLQTAASSSTRVPVSSASS